MVSVRLVTPGSQSLERIQTVIQQNEGIYGPLIGIGWEEGNTTLFFTVGPSPDADHRVLLDFYTDYPIPRPNFALVCSGSCLVDGGPKPVAAHRKKG